MWEGMRHIEGLGFVINSLLCFNTVIVKFKISALHIHPLLCPVLSCVPLGCNSNSNIKQNPWLKHLVRASMASLSLMESGPKLFPLVKPPRDPP